MPIKKEVLKVETSNVKLTLNDFIKPLFKNQTPMNEINNLVLRKVFDGEDNKVETFEGVSFDNCKNKVLEVKESLGFSLSDEDIKSKLSELKKTSKIPADNYKKLLSFVNGFCNKFYVIDKHAEPQTNKIQKMLKNLGINPSKGKTQTKINKYTLSIDILINSLHEDNALSTNQLLDDILLKLKKFEGGNLVEINSYSAKTAAYKWLADLIHYAADIEKRLPEGMTIGGIFNK